MAEIEGTITTHGDLAAMQPTGGRIMVGVLLPDVPFPTDVLYLPTNRRGAHRVLQVAKDAEMEVYGEVRDGDLYLLTRVPY